jgi:hypothetical protein
MCGGRLIIAWRSEAGVSPLRTATRIGGSAWPAASARARFLEVLLNVVGERLQRRDVDHQGPIIEPPRARHANELVDRPEKRRERLAGAGRRRDQGVAFGGDRAPTRLLRRCRRGEARREPLGDDGIETDVAHGGAHPTIGGGSPVACAEPARSQLTAGGRSGRRAGGGVLDEA